MRLVPGNRFASVEKDAETKRAITCEPALNLLVQRAHGIAIRDALLRVGIDLRDQTVNQRQAQACVFDGRATLDIKNASNSISYELVKTLLPWEWFERLLACRSHVTILPDGSELNLEFFSSMGNGFTFELETLIFWALAEVLGANPVVYGDDIIIDADLADDVVALYSHVGFETNPDKSFTSGWFYESCGKHYYLGVDVSPHLVRGDLSARTPMDVLTDINGLRRWQMRIFGELRGLERPLLELLPRPLRRLQIPDGYGDGGVVVFDVNRTQYFGRTYRIASLVSGRVAVEFSESSIVPAVLCGLTTWGPDSVPGIASVAMVDSSRYKIEKAFLVPPESRAQKALMRLCHDAPTLDSMRRRSSKEGYFSSLI